MTMKIHKDLSPHDTSFILDDSGEIDDGNVDLRLQPCHDDDGDGDDEDGGDHDGDAHLLLQPCLGSFQLRDQTFHFSFAVFSSQRFSD